MCWCGGATRVLPGDRAELPLCSAGAGGGHPTEPGAAQHQQGWPLPAADPLLHRDRAPLPLEPGAIKAELQLEKGSQVSLEVTVIRACV